MVLKLKGSMNDFVMIIKPSSESTFQNFVDIIDEVAINDVKHYYISEIEEADKKDLLQLTVKK